jgi:dienelactone hydrolase
VGLVALKYAGDVLLVGLGTGRFWTPLDYLRSIPFLMSTRFDGAPAWLMPALALWTIPFLWAGITLTLRRALDAGWSAWTTVAFFVPLVNYATMALLCLLPTSARPSTGDERPRPYERRLPSGLLAMAAGVLFGIGMVVLAVTHLRQYGLALFFGTPFGIGALTAFLFNRRYPASPRESRQVTLMTLVLTAGSLFLLGSEGAVCLLMALPLGVVVGLMGAAVGRAAALRGRSELSTAALALAVVPLGATLEPSTTAGRVLHEVRSSVVIAAPPDEVWDHVVSFRPIPEPDAAVFRLGIAYPRYARIEGTGVGAVRYCVFSSGAFVEPITHWESGRRLAFDVIESPPPLRELTPFADVEPPHLDGYLRSTRGEFRLVKLPNGNTRLEGSTWYRLQLAPEPYWQLFSDYLIHRIHHRVLRHIKVETEAAARVSATPDTVLVRSDRLALRALLWKPEGSGPFPAVLFNHGSYSTRDPIKPQDPAALGPLFARHGYVFLFLYRRGIGLSADQGPADGDLMARALATHGPPGRNEVQLDLLENEEMREAQAGLAFLRALPEVEAGRVAVAGHSFGGSLSLLLAARDSGVRAVVVFSGSARSWGLSPELRARLLSAVGHIGPVLFIHPANDYSTEPGKALAAEMQRLGRPHRLKIYPPYGRTAREGHNFLYASVATWEPDVFAFLNQELH